MEMVRKSFFSSYRMSPFQVEYDKDSYSVEHVNDSGMIILRRLKDNFVVKIFKDSINYLFQYNDGDKVHFVIEDYSNCMDDFNGKPRIMHFVDRGTSSLDLVKTFDGNGALLDKVHFGDCSFIVDTNGYGGHLYNLNEKSGYFNHIYCDKKVREYFGKDVILVSRICSESPNRDIEDRITYGIDAKTFDIVTPIWSELQQRLIPVYTEKEMNEILSKLNPYISYNPSEFTIWYEVSRYLVLLGKYYEKTDRVLNYDGNLNEEFVKKFVLK